MVRELARKQPPARKIIKLETSTTLNKSGDLLRKVASTDKASLSAAQDQEKCQMLSNIEALKCELAAKNELISKQEHENGCIDTVDVVSSMRDVVSFMREEFTCVICQELFISAHTLPCSHSFCEYCIKEWIRKKNVCPVCRKHNKSGAVYSLALDNAVATVASRLSAAEKREREYMKEEYKAKLRRTAVADEEDSEFSDNSTSTSDFDSDNYDSHDYYSDDSLSGTSDDSFANSSMVDSTDEDDYNYDNGYYGGYGRCFNCGKW